jgi:phosphonate metabolism-associated iron-containing alcohol dehydrogenase
MDSQSFAYYNPVQIRFGVEIYHKVLNQILGSSLRQAQGTASARLGLFYGHSAMKEIGAIDAIKRALSDYQIQEYGNISPNPDVRDIEAVLETFEGIDWVIGIGGGSVLDMAKSVAFMACQKENLRAFLTHENVAPPHPGLPFIAIPTTSGTGSEVTPWATVWDKQENKKFSLSHREVFPDYAIVDPTLTIGLPPYITAYTGYDALAHALEAFWSRFANPVSDLLAVEAIRLVMRHLERVVEDLSNLEHRIALAKASLYAGLAFSNTKTTAVHAVSYPMTLHYDVPHGVACSLTLAEFWRYNLDAIAPAKVACLLAAVGEKDPEAFAPRLKALAYQIGLPVTLAQAGIPRDGIEVILDEGFHPERVVNNPRPLTREDLREILERIYD